LLLELLHGSALPASMPESAGMRVVLVDLTPTAEPVESRDIPAKPTRLPVRHKQHPAATAALVAGHELPASMASDIGLPKQVQHDGEAMPAAAQVASDARRHEQVREHLERFKYYPVSARRRGIEGAVEVSFALDALGRAEALQVIAGSGYPILDDAALETVRRAQPFPVGGGAYRFRLLFQHT
jgi:TonB family protein